MRTSTIAVAALLVTTTALALVPSATALDTGICAGPVELSDCDGGIKACHDTYDEVICVQGPIVCVTSPCNPIPLPP